MQVPPQLSGADELLDIPLDEDCLHRLISGDLQEDEHAKAKVGRLLSVSEVTRSILSSRNGF